MNEIEYDSTKITSKQIQALLEIALGSTIENEFEQMVEFKSADLIKETRKRLENNKLGLPEAARLLGISEPLLKSWLKSPKALPEAAHHKLTGLCLILSLAENADDSDAGNQARTAVEAVQSGPSQLMSACSDETTRILTAVFGVTGLAVAALHSALSETTPRRYSGSEE